uniref:Uncharacterized protein n=1 Tax=Cacopsylla melanoneura TaxID=428564 RepID=A0A8D8TC98_9HEMI
MQGLCFAQWHFWKSLSSCDTMMSTRSFLFSLFRVPFFPSSSNFWRIFRRRSDGTCVECDVSPGLYRVPGATIMLKNHITAYVRREGRFLTLQAVRSAGNPDV